MLFSWLPTAIFHCLMRSAVVYMKYYAFLMSALICHEKFHELVFYSSLSLTKIQAFDFNAIGWNELFLELCNLFTTKTVSLYHNSSVWLDPREASSWHRNSVDFTSFRYLAPEPRNFLWILFTYTLSASWNVQFVRSLLSLGFMTYQP